MCDAGGGTVVGALTNLGLSDQPFNLATRTWYHIELIALILWRLPKSAKRQVINVEPHTLIVRSSIGAKKNW
jgi:hypothetical protein